MSKKPLFLSIYIISALLFAASAQASCSNPSPMPQGYASPCPVFSVSPASVSQTGTETLSASPQPGTDYIYTTAYYAKGSTWLPITLSGNNAAPSYSSGPASGSLSSAQLSSLALGTNYIVLWDWLWDATAQCYKGPGLNQCNTEVWRVQSFTITSTYAYSQSVYVMYAYSQSAYYTYSQAVYTGTVINVKTYGAVGDGVRDDTANINSAITALANGDELLFPCGASGIYKTTGSLNPITKQNVTVDGATGCAGGRVMIKSACTGCFVMRLGNGGVTPALANNASGGVALLANAAELATSFQTTVASLGGLSPGDFVLLQTGGPDSSTGSTATQCDISGCQGEVLQVATVSGNTVAVTTALHFAYNTANAAGAYRLTGVVSGVHIHDLVFDGGGSQVGTTGADQGLRLISTVNTTISNVTGQNVQGAAFFSRHAFNLAWTNVTITHAGSHGGDPLGDAFEILSQGNPSVNGMSLSALNQTDSSFGIGLGTLANGLFTNISVDKGGGSNQFGRAFKTIAVAYSTFNSLTVKNVAQRDNGASLEYYTSHNTFNNCDIENNSPNGVDTFGNFNKFNSFIGCTMKGNMASQFYQGASFDGSRHDDNTVISGGTIIGQHDTTNGAVIINSANSSVLGASFPPNAAGAAHVGIWIFGSNGCYKNIIFANGAYGSGFDIYVDPSAGSGNGGAGNTTPQGTTPSSLPVGSCA